MRTRQEIEELRRICCEETDRTRQARIDELSLHREKDTATVGQQMTQIQDLQNKVNSLSAARECHDPEKARAALERHTFPVSMIQGMLWVLQETSSKACLLAKDHLHLSSKNQRIWHHLLAG